MTKKENVTVIRDSVTLAEIQREWAGVGALRQQLQRSAFASAGITSGVHPSALVNTAYNLPFIHAFAVLNIALEQLKSEGHFVCNSHFLGDLLQCSEKALPWCDFKLIRAGVKLRNNVAHRGQLLERGDCWKYIDAVNAEFSAWRII
ncbi:MAG: hypothetical protein V3S35_03875 [Nitrosomonadaceae bacterium]|nr:hypothetical protein [Betaproteobacteria bacterium]